MDKNAVLIIGLIISAWVFFGALISGYAQNPIMNDVVYISNPKTTGDSTLSDKVAKLDFETSTLDDILKIFGEPMSYSLGNETFERYKLPISYMMAYPMGFQINMFNNRISDIRFFEPNYILNNSIYVGATLEQVEKVLGQPRKIIEGKGSAGLEDGVLYKDVGGRTGECVYSRYDKCVRLLFRNYRVIELHLIRSNPNSLPENWRLRAEKDRGKVDKTNYPFVDDPELVGKWLSVDFVNTIEQFNPEKKFYSGDLYIREITFIEGGKSVDNPSIRWTKDYIMLEEYKTAGKYEIKHINGETYLFFEWKGGDYTIRGMDPSYYVMKKVEEKENK